MFPRIYYKKSFCCFESWLHSFIVAFLFDSFKAYFIADYVYNLFHFFILFLATQCGLRDLSSLTRDRTVPPAVEVWSPIHWTAREFPRICFFNYATHIRVVYHFPFFPSHDCRKFSSYLEHCFNFSVWSFMLAIPLFL